MRIFGFHNVNLIRESCVNRSCDATLFSFANHIWIARQIVRVFFSSILRK